MWSCWSLSFWPHRIEGLLVTGLFLAAVVILIVWLVGRPGTGADNHRRSARADKDDALRLLARRLAEGSIDQEEYERLRRAIET